MYGNRTIRPFHFRELPSISRAEIDFFNTLANTIPIEIFSEDFTVALLQSLEKYIQTKMAWEYIGAGQLVTLEEMERFSLPPTLLVEVALLPLQNPIIAEVDPNIVGIMVDRALGGTGENSGGRRLLTEIERGVFTFFVLQIMHHVQQHWGNAANYEFRFAGLQHTFTHYRERFDSDALFYRKELRFGLGGQTGFLRFYIPHELVLESYTVIPRYSGSAEENELIRQRFHRIEKTPILASIWVGIVDLSESDLAQLEEDDIVLLRECSAQLAEEGFLEGEAILQFSQRANYGIRCRILDNASSQRTTVKLEEIISIAQPEMKGVLDRSEFDMDENQEYESEFEEVPEEGDNLEEMGQIVSDVSVPLVVELGRIEAKARDIIHLRVGQVLELRRSPYEPLDLVVNGEVFGKGELVEIEGQLGVRIVQLLK